jgi:hypothetical protein
MILSRSPTGAAPADAVDRADFLGADFLGLRAMDYS